MLKYLSKLRSMRNKKVKIKSKSTFHSKSLKTRDLRSYGYRIYLRKYKLVSMKVKALLIWPKAYSLVISCPK